MPEPLGNRLKHAWNAFMSRDPPIPIQIVEYGHGSYIRPDRTILTSRNDRTIVNSIYNRIAIDCSSIEIEHARLDENGRYLESIQSGLSNCLNLEANIDQTGRAFIQDAVISMFDEGCVALVPVDTTINPKITSSYDILSLRVGKVTQWYPQNVRIKVYNDRTGLFEEIMMPKASVAIIENPLYSVMNAPNSTLQRLLRKLSLLDMTDEQNSSGKLDMIIQLPYIIKTEARRQQAETRRKDIEMQLQGSKYGIAYTDGTEKITQLNRPVDNNLQSQVEYLTSMLYSQLGITTEIMNGTADEKVMANYYSRTIEPIMSAIVDEMKRKFLTKTARSQRQSIVYFKDPFKLVTITDLASIADTFTRSEIATSNEIRQAIGMKPSQNPKADELGNPNLYNNSAAPVEPSDKTGETEETDLMGTKVSDLE